MKTLPIATLFGVVRSSGVVGIDEKWVLVPKACGERSRTNDKPRGLRHQSDAYRPHLARPIAGLAA